MACLSLAVFIAVTCLAAVGRCGSLSGPFNVVLQEFVRCEDGGTNELYFDSMRLNRVDKDHVKYTLNVTLKVPLDENMKGTTEVSSWGNGGWKPNLNYDSPNLCEDVKKYIPELYSIIAASSGKEGCPIPEGRYFIDGDNTRLVNMKLKEFIYGKYRSISKLIRDDKVVGCIGLVFEVIPKKRNKKGK